jgi:hypothetical protein
MTISPQYTAELGRQLDELERDNARLRDALRHMVEITKGNSSPEFILSAIRTCAADALSREPRNPCAVHCATCGRRSSNPQRLTCAQEPCGLRDVGA